MITPSSPQFHRKLAVSSREIFLYGTQGFKRQSAVLPPMLLYKPPHQAAIPFAKMTTAAAAILLTGGYLVLASCAGSSDEGFKDGPPPKELEAEAQAQKQGQKQSGLPAPPPPSGQTQGQSQTTASKTPPPPGTTTSSSLPQVPSATPSATPSASSKTSSATAGVPSTVSPGATIPKPTPEQQKQALARGLVGDKAHAQYTDEEIRQIGEGEAEPPRPTRQAAQAPQTSAAKPVDPPVPPATPTAPVTSAPPSQLPPAPPPAPAVATPSTPTPEVPRGAATPTEIAVPDPVPPPPPTTPTDTVTLKRPPIVVEKNMDEPPPAAISSGTGTPMQSASARLGADNQQVVLRPPAPPPSVGPRPGTSSPSDPLPAPDVMQPQTQVAEATSGGPMQLRPPASIAPYQPATPQPPVLMQSSTMPPAMPPATGQTAYGFGSPQHLSSILFAHGSASLSDADTQLLAQIAAGVRATGSRLRIVGHASSRTSDMDITHHNEANYRISVARAQAVAAALITHGVPAQNILIEGHANSESLFFETMPSGEAGNRRTDIFIES